GQDALHERVRGLSDHIVARGVIRPEGESDEEQIAHDLRVDLEQTGMSAAGGHELAELGFAVADGLRGRLGADGRFGHEQNGPGHPLIDDDGADPTVDLPRDRKSTRLNSSHVSISYAVF